eukprot:2169172-Rhodomonas_salina.1
MVIIKGHEWGGRPEAQRDVVIKEAIALDFEVRCDLHSDSRRQPTRARQRRWVVVHDDNRREPDQIACQ